MISAIVIVASLVLAAAFVLAYALRPGLRNEIERPKHWFQDQVRRYDRRLEDEREAPGEDR
jgi:hypothetical protein